VVGSTSLGRLAHIERFYCLLDRLCQRVGGTRTLGNLGGFHDWPPRGVYFFFEPSEFRSNSGSGPRVVRIGTHALGLGSHSTLRQRLGQHRGGLSGGGNHRGSIFRLLVGQALLAKGDLPGNSWGVKGTAADASAYLGINREKLVCAEAPVEQAVSAYLGTLPFLWVSVVDEPSPDSQRGFIERNAIGLLSNHSRTVLDPPSAGWLGHFSNRVRVRGSGLWNQQHVDETYDPTFLNTLERMIANSGGLERLSLKPIEAMTQE
jgi:hypothetical protein